MRPGLDGATGCVVCRIEYTNTDPEDQEWFESLAASAAKRDPVFGTFYEAMQESDHVFEITVVRDEIEVAVEKLHHASSASDRTRMEVDRDDFIKVTVQSFGWGSDAEYGISSVEVVAHALTEMGYYKKGYAKPKAHENGITQQNQYRQGRIEIKDQQLAEDLSSITVLFKNHFEGTITLY
jgi:hypothetical protein